MKTFVMAAAAAIAIIGCRPEPSTDSFVLDRGNVVRPTVAVSGASGSTY